MYKTRCHCTSLNCLQRLSKKEQSKSFKMGSSYITIRSVLSVLSLIAYILTLILNGFATPNVRPGFLNDLYGNNLSTGDVSDKYSTEITPAGWAFSIWGVIYTWQMLWILYSLSLICRPHAPDVLNWLFHVLFICTCVFNSTWIIIWQRMKITGASIVLFCIAFNLYGLLALSYYRFNKLYDATCSKIDFYAIQALVHNGIAFYATWTTVASLLNMTIAITYVHDVANATASTVALVILTLEILVWFILENTVLERFLRYTVSQYPVLIVALSAIISKHWNSDKRNSIFSLVLLILVCVLFVIRILRVIYKIKTSRCQKTQDFSFKEGQYGAM
ncbi:uncharacterized protein LOC116294562 [Actinia tenebrosa]|uniref:Uncharacterized protein LOC116294562 n=1 Tax=Actinia tenebrosa TaxID=6105 RepID=A0A6P8HS99_ACTTE|nr:uncharacterized protein LOC116294562 [Actinia tenebrosa]